MKYIKRLLILVNLALVAALLLSYLSPGTDPLDNRVYPLFGVFYPLILLANLFMILLWILIDYKYVFISLIAVALGWHHLQGFINVSTSPTQTVEGISVMSYNMSNGYSLRDSDKNKEKENRVRFKNFLSERPLPNIVCLQESNTYVKNLFAKFLPQHKMHTIDKKGTTIFSDLPIVGGGNIEFGTTINSCIYADVVYHDDTVRVYNIHLQSNRVTKDADEVIENVDLNDSQTWSSFKTILSKYTAAGQKRSKQAKKVKNHAKHSPYPSMVVGDFNDPPTAFIYSVLSKGMHDAFLKKGSGIGTSYGGSIPMLRIDYILTDENMKVLDYDCSKQPFSDHYPIFAVVQP